MTTKVSKSEQAGRSVEVFMAAVGLSRTAFYQIPPELLPDRFMFGKKPIITEDPQSWVARVKENGGIKTLKRAAKAAE